MLQIIYPYRNRDLKRVERSLKSLEMQTDTNFKVHFVDYGSKLKQAKKVEALVNRFPFVSYTYHYTQHQPWNKSRALNSIIKTLYDGCCFVADVDMIFREGFIATAQSLQHPDTAVYFKVGFLDDAETRQDKPFADYTINFESSKEATGLTMFPVKLLKELHGFDEFYHFWGSEDTDVHVRFKNAGHKVRFYDTEILMLHQWHQSYRASETKGLSEALQLSGVVRLNFRHLHYNQEHNITKVNPEAWGQPMSKNDYTILVEAQQHSETIICTQDRIDHLLYHRLPNLNKGVYAFDIHLPEDYSKTLKNTIKQALGRFTESYYNLKEVNDMLLLQLITRYRDTPYLYQVDAKRQHINLTITI